MKKLRVPGIVNSRFLLGLLRVIVHSNQTPMVLTKIRTMMGMIDRNYYTNNTELITYLETIDIALSNMLSGLTDLALISNNISTSIRVDDNADIIDDLITPTIILNNIVSEQEVNYILGVVSTYSKVGFLLSSKDEVIDKFSSIESGHIGGIDSIVNDFEKIIADLHLKLYRALNVKDDKNEVMSLNDPEFLQKHFKLVYENSKKSSKVLKMGIKKLNEMLSIEKGALCGKMYVFNAPINSFKSSILLYIAKWIQLYNSALYEEEYKKNKKIPTVLVLSFENTWDENTERLFSMYSKEQIREIPTEESAANLWKKTFYKTNSIIDICLIYGKSQMFGPYDLEQKIDELESQGRIVIATIVDYLKVMKDDHNNSEKRHQVVAIATDLHEIVATRPHMALFTVHHTNRAGDELMNDSESRGGVDKVKLLGRQHLTEANAIEEPVDFTAYMVLEKSPYTGDLYLTFKKGKCRYERSDVEYFAHKLKNKFYLTDDLLLDKYLSVSSISETAIGGKTNNEVKSIYGQNNSARENVDVKRNNNSSLFEFKV